MCTLNYSVSSPLHSHVSRFNHLFPADACDRFEYFALFDPGFPQRHSHQKSQVTRNVTGQEGASRMRL